MRFLAGGFKVDCGGVEQYFANLPGDVRGRIFDYELLVYVCDGDESEKLDWFRRINIAGEVLNDQELLNAVFSGPWLTAAKRWFSRPGSAAAGVSENYVKGVAIRQEYLATALRWIARRDATSVEGYMGAHAHAHDANANELQNYFTSVVEWARSVFPTVRKELRSVDWARLYDEHGTRSDLDPQALETRLGELLSDNDVTHKSGVYEYVLTGRERLLSIRAFSARDKCTAYERQQGICPGCGEHFDYEAMQGDHIVPWSRGGHTVPENCQMLCRECNSLKSDH